MTPRNGVSATLRLSREEVFARMRETRASGHVPSTVDTMGIPLAIVSAERQVVYANAAFLDLAGGAGLEDICGDRPGEVLGCINSTQGCGDGEQCHLCGAAQAIGDALGRHVPSIKECHISVGSGERSAAKDFSVQGVPFEIGGRSYAMLTFTDISAQKRRAGLERIFFHDIMNTASSFRLYLDLLRRAATDDRSEALIRRLSVICDTLEEEIAGQKILVSAESGTLTVQKELLDSGSLVTGILEQAGGWTSAEGRLLCRAPFSESFSLISDDALLKRILGNMVKNALEAVEPGETVTVGSRADAAGNAVFTVHNPSCIPMDVRQGIFRRYFSTRGEGRGLGTWGMKLLAEEYLGGSVTFTTGEQEGTTFTLSVPLKPRGFSKQAPSRG